MSLRLVLFFIAFIIFILDSLHKPYPYFIYFKDLSKVLLGNFKSDVSTTNLFKNKCSNISWSKNDAPFTEITVSLYPKDLNRSEDIANLTYDKFLEIIGE